MQDGTLEHNSSIVPKVKDEKEVTEVLLTQSVRISSNTKNLATCNDRTGKKRTDNDNATATLISQNRSSNDNGPIASTNILKSGMITDPPT